MKFPAGKGNPELLKQISEVFGVIPGIEEVTVNPTTGSDRPALRLPIATMNSTATSSSITCRPTAAANGGLGAMHGADTELDKLTGKHRGGGRVPRQSLPPPPAPSSTSSKGRPRDQARDQQQPRPEDHLQAAGIIAFTVFEVRGDRGDAGLGHAGDFHRQPLHRNARAAAAQQRQQFSTPGAGPGQRLKRLKGSGVGVAWNSRSVTSSPAVSGCICRRCAENKNLRKPRSPGWKRSRA